MPSSDDKVLKKSMRANSPRRLRKGEPGYGKKKFVVRAKVGEKERTIRFGDAKMSIKRDDPKHQQRISLRRNTGLVTSGAVVPR